MAPEHGGHDWNKDKVMADSALYSLGSLKSQWEEYSRPRRITSIRAIWQYYAG